jgi:hypothetical protein
MCDLDTNGQVTCSCEEKTFVSIARIHDIHVTTKIWYCPICFTVFDSSVKLEHLTN